MRSKTEKAAAAKALAEQRAKRSTQQQISELDFRLGKNVGAKRERSRLQKSMAKDSQNGESVAPKTTDKSCGRKS